MVRFYLRFTGRVQGVGFRFFAAMNAEMSSEWMGKKYAGWFGNSGSSGNKASDRTIS